MEWKMCFLLVAEFLFLGTGTYFDLKSRELPLAFLIGFAMLGILLNIIWKYQTLELILGGVFLGGIFLLLGKITRQAIGYGDGLCFVILGIFKGWKSTLGMLGVAFFLSGIYGLWKMIGCGGKSSDTMPFLPFLFLAWIGDRMV